MALDINSIKFILYSKSLGVDFSSTALIGRQFLYISKKNLMNCFDLFEYNVTDSIINSILENENGYSESFFKFLGASNIHSFDISKHENASYICDLDKPLQKKYKKKYSFVLDGGTLEHIFNFPLAIKNCMEMVKVGGYYMGISPANNIFAHGFYQFSPEIYFQIFSKNNGFSLKKIILYEDDLKPNLYEPLSSTIFEKDISFVNYSALYMIFLSKRHIYKKIFNHFPNQIKYKNYLNRKFTNENVNSSINKFDIFYQRYIPKKIRELVFLFFRFINIRKWHKHKFKKFNF